MFGLAHIDAMPLLYGVLMFLGLWSMWHKFETHQWFSGITEVLVFLLVFRLHGGTLQGGFAAMICALIWGTIIPVFRRRRK